MKRLRVIGINLIVFMVILFIVDIVLGLTMNIEKDKEEIKRYAVLREHTPNTDRIIRPTPEYLKGTINLQDTTYRLRTDSDGFIRGPRISNNNANVVFLGGSTTECLYVNEALRFPYLTGELLTDESGKAIRTLNGGKSGNNSWHSMLQLVAKGLSYRPKMVVWMHNVNDLTGLTKTGSYWTAPKSRAMTEAVEPEEPHRVKSFMKATKDMFIPNIWHLVVTSLASEKTNKKNDGTDEWKNFRQNDVTENPDIETLTLDYMASIRSFVAVSKAWGSVPILMTQFNRYDAKNPDPLIMERYNSYPQDFSYEVFCDLYSAFNDGIRQVAQEEQVLLIDLAREVPRTTDYIYDGVHLNNTGSELVANLIARSISRRFPNEYVYKNSVEVNQ